MLIRFGVENHLSIREKQELSLVASALKDEAADLIEGPGGLQLVPSAILYGANASGKSNFVAALSFLQNAVRYSHERGDPDSIVPRTPFLLDGKSREAPTQIDIDFVLEGVRFHYGFAATDKSFVDEWLYAFPSGKKQTWYLRESGRKQIYFGKNLRGASKTIETLMRPNSLFLSVAAQNAHKQLTPLYRYLTNLSLHYRIRNRTPDVFEAFSEGRMDNRIISFLKQADTGIVSYRFDDIGDEVKSAAFMSDLIQLLKKHVPESDKVEIKPQDLKAKRILLGHQTDKGEPRFLDLDLESSGTLRLLVLLKAIFSALDNGSLVVIDELDASLHTYLSEKIVELFNSRKTNPKGAQLIATTHDTNLLCGKLLRRDQIWFAEKDRAGATKVYPLSDIRVRNTQNIEKGYLEGRFGAVPFRGPVELLVDGDNL